MGIRRHRQSNRFSARKPAAAVLVDALEPRRLFAVTPVGAYAFGTSPASVTDADGTTAKFSLPGGRGVVTVADDGWHVTISKATAASSLAITTSGGDGRVTLASFLTSKPLGSINAPKANLSGSMTLTNVKSVTLGNLSNLAIGSTSALTSLTIASWSDTDATLDALIAPSITSLNVKGNFAPVLTLSSKKVALNSATIGGTASGSWAVAGSAGTLKLHAVRSPDLTISGNVTQLSLGDAVGLSPYAVKATGGVLHFGGKGSVAAANGKDKFKVAKNTTVYTCTAATYTYSDLTGNTQIGSTLTYTRKGRTQIVSIDKYVSNGLIHTTGKNTDLAIEGDGFFVVNGPNGQQYTRDGSFTLNTNRQLVTGSGAFVQGYGVDSAGSVVVGKVQDITIPLGAQIAAKATGTFVMEGNLNASGAIATGASAYKTQALQTSGGGIIDPTTLLTDVESMSNPGVPLFATAPGANTLTLNAKTGTGAATLPTATFTVTPTSTVGDLLDFFNQSLGIDTGVTTPPAPTPGATIDPTGTQIIVNGNVGTANSLTMAPNALKDATTFPPFSFTQDTSTTPSGESVHTSAIAYDTLGQQISVNVNTVLESRNAGGGTTWRFFVTSPDNAGGNLVLGNGTLEFDGSGQLVRTTGATISIDRTGSGADPSLPLTLDFSGISSLQQPTDMRLSSQDGYPAGSLNDFSIGADGVITGTYSNGLTKTLGQIVVAKFDNPAGLADVYTYSSPGPNGQTDTYSVSPAAGTRLLRQDADSDAVRLNASFSGSGLALAPSKLSLGATTRGSSAVTLGVSDEGVGGTMRGSAASATRFVGHELVTTPAGTFLAAKVITTLSFNTSGTISDGENSASSTVVVNTAYTRWFVPGVGAVRVDTARAVTIKVPSVGITRTHKTSTKDELATKPTT